MSLYNYILLLNPNYVTIMQSFTTLNASSVAYLYRSIEEVNNLLYIHVKGGCAKH